MEEIRQRRADIVVAAETGASARPFMDAALDLSVSTVSNANSVNNNDEDDSTDDDEPEYAPSI